MEKRCAWDDGLDPDHSTSRNKEHALGQQMGTLVGGPAKFSVVRATIKSDGDASTRNEWSSSTPTGWISKSFCEVCNAGWMARIDDAAKPVLAKLLADQALLSPVPLTEADCEAISLWAYKLSLVFQHVAGELRSAPEVFHDLFQSRKVPDHAAVAIGATSFTYANNAYGYVSEQLPFSPDAVVPIFTLLLRHVVIQVVSSASGRPLVSTPEFSIPLRDPARVVVAPRSPDRSLLWRPSAFVDSEEKLRGLFMGQPFPI